MFSGVVIFDIIKKINPLEPKKLNVYENIINILGFVLLCLIIVISICIIIYNNKIFIIDN